VFIDEVDAITAKRETRYTLLLLLHCFCVVRSAVATVVKVVHKHVVCHAQLSTTFAMNTFVNDALLAHCCSSSDIRTAPAASTLSNTMCLQRLDNQQSTYLTLTHCCCYCDLYCTALQLSRYGEAYSSTTADMHGLTVLREHWW
jgi:hypothetical protein